MKFGLQILAAFSLLTLFPRPGQCLVLRRRRDVDQTPPSITVPELDALRFPERVASFRSGAYLYMSSRPDCRAYSTKMMVSCAPQYKHVMDTFGTPSFAPNITPEMQTPAYLASLPHPTTSCCEASAVFHGNECGCDVQTIEAFRKLMLFDPEMTVPGSIYLYGELCGGPVKVGDLCPNGNPFDLIRAEESRN